MVRISATVLAFAATAMTAAVHVRSAGDVSFGSPHSLHARAVSGTYLERRQAAKEKTEADKKFEEFKATFTDEQNAKEKEADQKAEEADNSLSEEQNAALKEVRKLDEAGKTNEADAKLEAFKATLSKEQTAKEKAVEDKMKEIDDLLTPEQTKLLDEVKKLDEKESGKDAKGGK